jgi:WD40 repeat protein
MLRASALAILNLCLLSLSGSFEAAAQSAPSETPLGAPAGLSAARAEPIVQRGFWDNWYRHFKRFSRDGKRFVSQLNRSGIGVWDTHSGEAREQWQLPSGSIEEGELLGDDRTLALIESEPATPGAADDDTPNLLAQEAGRYQSFHLRWRHLDSGAPLKTLLSLSDNEIHHLTLSPDGRFLAAVIGDRSGYVLQRYGNSERENRDVLALWSAHSGELLWRQVRKTAAPVGKPEIITRVLFSPDSSRVAALVASNSDTGSYGTSGNRIEVHDTKSGVLRHEISAPAPGPRPNADSVVSPDLYFSELRFLPAARRIVAWGKGDYFRQRSPGAAAAWSLDTGQLAHSHVPVARTGAWDNFVGVFATTDPEQFVFFDTRRRHVERWNAVTGNVQRHILQGMDAKAHNEASAYFEPATWTLRVTWSVFDTTRRRYDSFSGAWDVRSGRRSQSAPAKRERGAFDSQDGRWRASINEMGGLTFLDRQSGRLARADVAQPFHFPIRAVAFAPLAPGRTLLALASDGEVAVWDVTARRMRFFPAFAGQQITDVSFSPDGRFLACGGGLDLERRHHGAVKVWDLNSGQSRVFALRPRIVTALAWVNGGRTLAVASGLAQGGKSAGDVSLWDARSGRLSRTLLTSSSSVTALAASPSGTQVLCVGFAVHQVRDVRSGKAVVQAPEPSEGNAEPNSQWRKAAALTRDASVAVHNRDSTIFVWNARDGALLQSFTHRQFDPYPSVGSSRLLEMTISDDGRYIAATDSAGRLVRAERPSTAVTVDPMPSLGTTRALAFAPRTSLLLAADNDGTARFYDAQSGALRLSLMFSRPAPNAPQPKATPTQWIAWTPDGSFDASPGALRFLRWRSGDEMRPHGAAFAARRDGAAIARIFSGVTAPP